MTDKVQKNQIADILLDFYDEYDSNVINRPMIPNIYAGKILDSLQEEPVSDSLEKAATKYAQDKYMPVQTSQAFKAGAKWQREKGESTTEDLGDYINELSKQFPEVSFAKLSRIAVRVAKWQREQMLKDAVEWKVLINGMGNPILHLWDKGKHLIDKKVKVILIKEE